MFSATSDFSDSTSRETLMPNVCSSHGVTRVASCPASSGRRFAASITSACTSGIRTTNSTSRTTPKRKHHHRGRQPARDVAPRGPVDDRRAEVGEDRADQERRQHRAQVAQAEDDDERGRRRSRCSCAPSARAAVGGGGASGGSPTATSVGSDVAGSGAAEAPVDGGRESVISGKIRRVPAQSREGSRGGQRSEL